MTEMEQQRAQYRPKFRRQREIRRDSLGRTGTSDQQTHDPRLRQLILVRQLRAKLASHRLPSEPTPSSPEGSPDIYDEKPVPKLRSTSSSSSSSSALRSSSGGGIHAHAAIMDRIWNGYRRQPNKGSYRLFEILRPNVEALARRMYGEAAVARVRYGQHKHTAYILVELREEPEGAEGHAADEFMRLGARFYEVLRDGQAGERDALANPECVPADLVARDGLAGLSLVDLYEVQVAHPISGRLLVGPIEKQRRFMGL